MKRCPFWKFCPLAKRFMDLGSLAALRCFDPHYLLCNFYRECRESDNPEECLKKRFMELEKRMKYFDQKYLRGIGSEQ